MGLGKTLQVISLLLAERQDYDAGGKGAPQITYCMSGIFSL